MSRLDGKIAIVTGAAQGIGLAIAERFIEEGARVLMVDRNIELGAAEARRIGKAAVFHAADVGQANIGPDLVAAATESLGRPSILANNAAVIDNGHFLELPIEEFDRVIAVNLRSYFTIGQAVSRDMVEVVKAGGKPGSIVNMSSVNEHFALPDHVAYTVAKGGVRQLTRAMAVALASYGIRANAIGPGTIETPLIRNVAVNIDAKRRMLSRTPMGRFGQPSEVASIAAFLASDDASYITGETIYCDGGRIPLNYTVPVLD